MKSQPVVILAEVLALVNKQPLMLDGWALEPDYNVNVEVHPR